MFGFNNINVFNKIYSNMCKKQTKTEKKVEKYKDLCETKNFFYNFNWYNLSRALNMPRLGARVLGANPGSGDIY